MSTKDQDVRDCLRREVRERCRQEPIRILLTGSRARGDEREDSDWDIAAIVDDETPSLPCGPIVRGRFKAPDGNEVDLLIIPPADFESGQQRFFVELRANHVDL